MRSIFSNNYESDNDERLDKKFSYNYQVIKRMYPKASELPEEEVRGIIRKYYQAPKGQEEQVIKDYIRQKEPEWQQLYGLDYEDKEETEDSNSFWQPMQNNDFWGGYGNKQNTSSSTMQPMTEQERREYDEELIDAFYNHLKQAGIEGYKNFIYCDTGGLNTTGSGLRVPTLKSLSGYTMTMNNAPVSTQNPALTMAQKADYLQRQNEFCNTYSYIDQNGQKVWDVPWVKTQVEDYIKRYGEHQPYFQDDELEAAGKEYIRRSVLPVLKEKLEKHNIDFYDTFNQKGQIALMDLLYNLGEDKFKLDEGPIDEGYWPGLTKALIARSAKDASRNTHRKNIGDDRNELIKNYMLQGFR